MTDPTADLRPGTRVVVRYRRDVPDGGPPLTDVVGELVAADELTVSVAGRRGVVTVARSAVVAAKEVPPRPSRRGAPHLALSIEDLQRLTVDGWPALEVERLGEWVLRAAGGFTSRANSVLAVGSPGLPLSAAVDRVEQWYAARGQPAIVSLAGPSGFLVADDPLGAELLRRGYRSRAQTLVLTAATGTVTATETVTVTEAVAPALPPAGPSAPPPVEVAVTESLEPSWLAAYARSRPLDPGVATAVLTGSPQQLFATATAEGATVAVARLSIAHAWGGLAALWVEPAHRRRGLATTLTTELARQARARGIRSLWLQVEADNAAALALYERLGFAVHHAYEYLVAPGS